MRHPHYNSPRQRQSLTRADHEQELARDFERKLARTRKDVIRTGRILPSSAPIGVR